MLIRDATSDDAADLSALILECVREGYVGHPGATADELRRDVLGPGRDRHRVLLAQSGKGLIGFISWDPVYDMHWAQSGAQIADLYVAPARRGLGVALALIAAVCARTDFTGGTFVRGGAYDRESTRRFYSRFAEVTANGDTHVSGNAFRELAALAGRAPREILRALSTSRSTHARR
jgi:predicted N-acetyltransferase YhbS